MKGVNIMLKKNIKYTDYNGVERNEDFYFNLSKAEITEMELSTTGGLAEMINKVVAAQDVPSIIKIFKELIIFWSNIILSSLIQKLPLYSSESVFWKTLYTIFIIIIPYCLKLIIWQIIIKYLLKQFLNIYHLM